LYDPCEKKQIAKRVSKIAVNGKEPWQAGGQQERQANKQYAKTPVKIKSGGYNFVYAVPVA